MMDTQESVLTMNSIHPGIKAIEFQLLGPVSARAKEIQEELKNGIKKPFKEVIWAHIGNCHALGETPLTFVRQVLALVCYPNLINESEFPDDVKERANLLLSHCPGGSVGSYSDPPGHEIIRRHVAEYIEKRDGFPSNWQDITLCNGASGGIQFVLEMLACDTSGLKAGVMIPVPEFSLYSAILNLYGMHKISYYLNESRRWSLTRDELKRAVDKARSKCVPRALVLINPGNPTGQVFTKRNIEEIIKFAYDEHLILIADEVYQFNIYDKCRPFHSFKKVLMELGPPYSQMQLASFMSCSKGYLGECGLRGGYIEMINFDPDVRYTHVNHIACQMCSSVPGQVAMDCLVKPPEPGQPSYDLYEKEKTRILRSFLERAKMVSETLNSVEGLTCNDVQGSMYAFPRIHLPPKAIELAKLEGKEPDEYYVSQLLELRGVCVVAGSCFGQEEDTYHFRIALLPPPETFQDMLIKINSFHEEFTKYHV